MFSLRKPRRAWKEARALWGPLAPVMIGIAPFAREFVDASRNRRMRWEGGILYLGNTQIVHTGMHVVWPDGSIHANNFQPSMEGMIHSLNVEYGATSQVTVWYVAPYSGAVDPSESNTAATFTSTFTEVTNYTQGTRVEWDDAAASGGSGVATKGSTSASQFTADTGGMSIVGFGLLSASTKSATTGFLAGASRLYTSAIAVPATTNFNVNVQITGDS